MIVSNLNNAIIEDITQPLEYDSISVDTQKVIYNLLRKNIDYSFVANIHRGNPYSLQYRTEYPYIIIPVPLRDENRNRINKCMKRVVMGIQIEVHTKDEQGEHTAAEIIDKIAAVFNNNLQVFRDYHLFHYNLDNMTPPKLTFVEGMFYYVGKISIHVEWGT